jgi:prenylcysteine alpha-carboxyl methylesterase
LQAASGEAVVGASPPWDTARIRHFVGVSGCYDLQGLAHHLHGRGLYKSLLESIMSINGQPAWEVLSPLAAGARAGKSGAARFMPPCVLMHGTDDRSCPYESSLKMDVVLRAAKVRRGDA